MKMSFLILLTNSYLSYAQEFDPKQDAKHMRISASVEVDVSAPEDSTPESFEETQFRLRDRFIEKGKPSLQLKNPKLD